jgi:release factor glutamine methyltransferase
MSFSSRVLYQQAVQALAPLYGEAEASQLSRLLLEDQFNLSIEKVLIDAEIDTEDRAVKEFQRKLEEVKNYRPVQYVLGKAHFYGREFIVDENVLIPRQETEELVNEILVDNNRQMLKVLDIGAGSGCIGLTLGMELPGATISAIDVSEGALEISKKNAEKFGLHIKCFLIDILELQELPDQYDIIVSNPPYIRNVEREKMHSNVLDHEPDLALFVPDNQPLLFYSKILELAQKGLKRGGRLYFEINESQGADMIQLCEGASCTSVVLLKDLNGKDRIVKARFD